jgi:nucleoside diphosphate kinase
MSGTVGIITTMKDERGLASARTSIASAVVGNCLDFKDGTPFFTATQPSEATLTTVRAVPGVTGIAVVHADPTYPWNTGAGWGGGTVSCTELATIPAFGACAPGLTTAKVASNFEDSGLSRHYQDSPWPMTDSASANLSVDQLKSTPVVEVVVNTDGSASAVELARTILGNAYPDRPMPATVGEDLSRQQTQLNSYIQLANVVIMLTFPIAGCSLAVAVAGSLSDRKRTFSLMRLSGVQLGVLRRVVLLESAAPLLAVSAVAIGTGFLGAHLFLKAQLEYSLHAPGTAYYAMVGGGIVLALAIIMSTLPLLRRISGPEVARND